MRTIQACVALGVAAAGARGDLLASGSESVNFGVFGEFDSWVFRFGASREGSFDDWLIEQAGLDDASGGLVLTAEPGDAGFDDFEMLVTNGTVDWIRVGEGMGSVGSAIGRPEPEAFEHFIDGDPDRVDLAGWDLEEVRVTLRDVEFWWDGENTNLLYTAEFEMFGTVPAPGAAVCVGVALVGGVRRRRG